MVYHGDIIMYQRELWCTGGNYGVPRVYYSVKLDLNGGMLAEINTWVKTVTWTETVTTTK